MSETILQILGSFNAFTKKPHKYLSPQSEITDDIKSLVKNIYDFTKINETNDINRNALPELIVENFDDEQIWQELELQNEDCNNSIISDVATLVAKKDRLTFPVRLKGDENLSESEENKNEGRTSDNDAMASDDGENLGDELDVEDEEEFDNESIDSDIEKRTTKKKQGTSKPSVVDDKFFKLSDMEHFLESEEKNEGKSAQSSELINFFEDVDDPTSETDMYYNDFFEPLEGMDNERDQGDMEDEELDQENMEDDEFEDDMENEEFNLEDEKDNVEFKKSVRFNLDDDDNEEETEIKDFTKKTKEDDGSPKIKSTLELRQERLGKLINRLEEEAISEKPWQLKGEISAGTRPQNSLLEEVVDFDITSRPAPIMTEETTLRLEDIILRRIKDKSWDDVERKVKPVETPSEFKKKLVLDQEKSKLSLAQIYEQEFIKQRDASKQEGDDTEEQEVELPLHNQVRSMLTSLFNKLDALSNYHYTPRPAVPELKIVSNERAITMEEVAPVATADSALLAPEEIQGKRKGNLMSKDERSQTDKKRARRIKKKRQREQQKSKEQLQKTVNRLNPGLGNKYSKQKAEQDLKKVLNERNVSKMEEKSNKSVRSSTTFFRNLQDEVSSTIKSKTQLSKKKKDAFQPNAKKLKL